MSTVSAEDKKRVEPAAPSRESMKFVSDWLWNNGEAELWPGANVRDAARIVDAYEEDKRWWTPEGCILVAHDTGDGWYLGVKDSKGNTVAMLDWPKAWPETMSASRLREIGFEIV